MAAIFPNGVTANRQTRILSIDWNDGHHSDYPFSLVRAACPCAECRGGHENMSSEPDPRSFEINLPESEKTRIKNVQASGS
jgi:DUF971 family protein